MPRTSPTMRYATWYAVIQIAAEPTEIDVRGCDGLYVESIRIRWFARWGLKLYGALLGFRMALIASVEV